MSCQGLVVWLAEVLLFGLLRLVCECFGIGYEVLWSYSQGFIIPLRLYALCCVRFYYCL